MDDFMTYQALMPSTTSTTNSSSLKRNAVKIRLGSPLAEGVYGAKLSIFGVEDDTHPATADFFQNVVVGYGLSD